MSNRIAELFAGFRLARQVVEFLLERIGVLVLTGRAFLHLIGVEALAVAGAVHDRHGSGLLCWAGLGDRALIPETLPAVHISRRKAHAANTFIANRLTFDNSCVNVFSDMNTTASGNRRGWVRGSRLASDATQIELLKRYDVRPIYNAKDTNFADYLKSLRVGDEVWVTSLGRLAGKRSDLRRAVDLIHKKKCVIVEAASERRSDRDGASMALDAADELMGEARALSPEDAKRFGAKGGQVNAKRVAEEFKDRMPRKEALKLWTDTDLARLSNIKVLRKMPGWTQRAAYRHLGPRGLAKGRPRGDGTISHRNRPGRVYFMQNGRRRVVKIGYSGDHIERLGSLQAASPDRLRLIATIPGSPAVEAELHKRFRAYRVTGEWFRLEGELAEYVAGIKDSDET